MLRVLDLFSGIGGFSLGLERTGGFETVAFCEIEDYPRRVLAKHWPDVPCYEDVKGLTHERLAADGLGGIDIIVGGYPCQPFSTAGQRRGAEDDRHLWPEVKRLMATVRPAWGVFENVAGHVSMGLDEVLSDLESEGYTAWPTIIPACAVDAPHRRDRVWIVANSNVQRKHHGLGEIQEANGEGRQRDNDAEPRHTSPNENVAHATQLHRDGGREYSEPSERQVSELRKRSGAEFMAYSSGKHLEAIKHNGKDRGTQVPKFGSDYVKHGRAWLPEPNVGRVAHGVSSRVDRLKCLGNAVVPQIPEMIGYAILEAEAADRRNDD
ncbi:MAG: DNA cytosine methyltransferase [Pseudomonadales bacterium]